MLVSELRKEIKNYKTKDLEDIIAFLNIKKRNIILMILLRILSLLKLKRVQRKRLVLMN